MDQQIAPTLWVPRGMCFLNPISTMQMQHTSTLAPYQVTSHAVKHPMYTVPAANLLHNQHLLQQTQFLPPTQNIIHIPFENLLLPSPGKQPYEIAPPLVELPPCQPVNLQAENHLPLPPSSTLLPTDPTFHMHHLTLSKVTKKKRISPSAKRRSRLRLITFLEQKKKQQNELSSLDENQTLQPRNDIFTTYPKDAATPPSSDDATLSPQST